MMIHGTRRNFLKMSAAAAGIAPFSRVLAAIAFARQGQTKQQPAAKAQFTLSKEDDAFLDEIERRSFRYFWEQTDSNTGIVRGRAHTDASPYDPVRRDCGSTGVTGFGITALCIAVEHGWVPREQARERVRNTLRFYAERAKDEHGWFYHWLNVVNGRRTGAAFDSAVLPVPQSMEKGRPRSEVSVSDSTWLIAGGLTAKQYFKEDPEIGRLAMKIYERVDYGWMRNGHPYLLSHGWMPETGFIVHRYEKYCQLALMYLLGIGSPARPLPPEAWYAWERNPNSYAGYKYIGESVLWTYQYPFAWADFRGRREKRPPHTDWWGNAIIATRAHRAFCLDLRQEFPGYSQDMWGITSSMSATGYKAWGGPPRRSSIDGSVVPCAAAGALMMAPDIALPVLNAMKARFGDKIWGRYGFTDAFNPNNGWVSPDVIGLDVGITLLSAENLRTGNVWKWFMRNPEVVRAMRLAGLEKTTD
jgi:hypothetical protein